MVGDQTAALTGRKKTPTMAKNFYFFMILRIAWEISNFKQNYFMPKTQLALKQIRGIDAENLEITLKKMLEEIEQLKKRLEKVEKPKSTIP